MDAHPHIERRSQIIRLSDQAANASVRLFYGGSFDPPHLGHAGVPGLVGQAIGGNARIIYVPAGRSPFKPDLPAENQHRLNMLEAALGPLDGWEIWTQELSDSVLNPGEPSYWSDTWAIVRSMGLGGEDHFLIGADQACSMHRWRRSEEFWLDALVMLRDEGDSLDSLMDRLAALGVWNADELACWRSRVVVVPKIEGSSSHIRAFLGNPATRQRPIAGLDPEVQRYILEHGLYT